ncbi:hypothetical protein [Nannocystis radixulma]|uniref:Uncharacterized protein n=1 Tax=Nannocystis radixulma TaxID=2995305 RepID=A0ABT5B8Q5_9BACT|nr:hypothetical protein [Nannocystis radixulma]MDC0670098.1 hypothetical protein [Nannocystis radixulma]
MHEWLYRASNAKADSTSTQTFADEFGFICRSAFADVAHAQMIANVAKVDFGDVVHLYFVDSEGAGRSLGAYRVVGPHRHPRGQLFGAAVPKTKLRTVADGPLRDRLRDDSGYAVDPRVGEFCGWPVVRDDHVSPSYVRDLFVGRNTLVPR